MALQLFSVSYDLQEPGKDYRSLTTELQRLGAKKVLLSHWVLRSSKSAVQLRDHLKTFIDGNDRLFVAQVPYWASFNAMATPKDI